MGRCKECPRYGVLSFRASDDEMLIIYEEAEACGLSLSDYLRRAVLSSAVRDAVNRGLSSPAPPCL